MILRKSHKINSTNYWEAKSCFIVSAFHSSWVCLLASQKHSISSPSCADRNNFERSHSTCACALGIGIHKTKYHSSWLLCFCTLRKQGSVHTVEMPLSKTTRNPLSIHKGLYKLHKRVPHWDFVQHGLHYLNHSNWIGESYIHISLHKVVSSNNSIVIPNNTVRYVIITPKLPVSQSRLNLIKRSEKSHTVSK